MKNTYVVCDLVKPTLITPSVTDSVIVCHMNLYVIYAKREMSGKTRNRSVFDFTP